MAGVEDASDLITDLSRQSPAEWPIAYHHLRPVPKPAELPEELAFPGHDLLSLRRRDDGTAKPQSPSRLETLLVSPLAWLLAEVGAEDMSWATEELDVLARGNIAHDVFEHGVDEIDVMLKTRYQEWASERRAELARLHRELEDLALEGGAAAFLSEILRHEDGKQDLQFGALLEALDGRREVAGASWTGREMLGLFEKLLMELAGDDEAENNDTQKARLDAWLNDYSGREGNFARMMSGATAPQTRRMLQSAFNRSSSWPMVLLAQSRVGREGLNLHEACRTVILLHAEWNPGIVEQQIGRVDRKNSLWLREWRKWRDHGDGLPPRIRVHPVVVSGTYDDHNWQVLKARWLELRAQLHGDVLRPVPGRSEVTDDKRTCADRVRRAVPDFSPGERGG